MFRPGDVVHALSPSAGKPKFHICVGASEEHAVFLLLFVNSDGGYRGDCTLSDGAIPGLPPSRTGQSVVSFSMVVRLRFDRVEAQRATRCGAISRDVAEALLAHAVACDVLSRKDRAAVVAGLREAVAAIDAPQPGAS